jgi:hypothetical protein
VHEITKPFAGFSNIALDDFPIHKINASDKILLKNPSHKLLKSFKKINRISNSNDVHLIYDMMKMARKIENIDKRWEHHEIFQLRVQTTQNFWQIELINKYECFFHFHIVCGFHLYQGTHF